MVTKIFSISFSLVLLFWSNFIISQNSEISEKKEDQKNIDFQTSFFKALTQKSIYNYQKAIDNLDQCNSLIPNNIGVLFELSKNYLLLNKLIIATEYAKKALAIEPDNLWVLEHLVDIYKKSKNFEDAIATQKKIIEKHPRKKQKLVFLHLQNKDRKAAKTILEELARAKMLNPRLRNLQKRLTQKKKSYVSYQKVVFPSKNNLKKEFEKKKSFSTLKKLLQKLASEKNTEFLEYTEKGLNLYPAQPYVYLMNGKALNQKGNFKKAVTSLENGIDFIIDDIQMENKFYKEIIKSYQNLGNFKKVEKYQKKIK